MKRTAGLAREPTCACRGELYNLVAQVRILYNRSEEWPLRQTPSQPCRNTSDPEIIRESRQIRRFRKELSRRRLDSEPSAKSLISGTKGAPRLKSTEDDRS